VAGLHAEESDVALGGDQAIMAPPVCPAAPVTAEAGFVEAEQGLAS